MDWLGILVSLYLIFSKRRFHFSQKGQSSNGTHPPSRRFFAPNIKRMSLMQCHSSLEEEIFRFRTYVTQGPDPRIFLADTPASQKHEEQFKRAKHE